MHIMARKITGAVLVLTLIGCSTMSSNRPLRSEFEDIPVPKGLSYVDGDSTIIESPTVKAAKLVYRGRVEPVSLGAAIRSTLEANGWRHISTATAGSAGTTQVYDKPQGNALQVKVWEGWYYTYVELTASRAVTTSGMSPAAAPSSAYPTASPSSPASAYPTASPGSSATSAYPTATPTYGTR